MFYINYTVQVWKDDVLLFERDCELGIDYDLPDGRRGPVDWDVNEFHFSDTDENGKPIYTKINRHELLFLIMYKDLDTEWLDERIRETLAANGIVDLYGDIDYGRD
jgi:hypothetical protein